MQPTLSFYPLGACAVFLSTAHLTDYLSIHCALDWLSFYPLRTWLIVFLSTEDSNHLPFCPLHMLPLSPNKRFIIIRTQSSQSSSLHSLSHIKQKEGLELPPLPALLEINSISSRSRWQTDRQTDRCIYRQTDVYIDRKTDVHIYIYLFIQGLDWLRRYKTSSK